MRPARFGRPILWKTDRPPSFIAQGSTCAHAIAARTACCETVEEADMQDHRAAGPNRQTSLLCALAHRADRSSRCATLAGGSLDPPALWRAGGSFRACRERSRRRSVVGEATICRRAGTGLLAANGAGGERRLRQVRLA